MESNLGNRNSNLGSRGSGGNLGSKITVIPSTKGPSIKKAGQGINTGKVAIVGVAVVVVLAIIYFALTGSSVSTITTNKTLTLAPNQSTIFQLGANANTRSALYLYNVSNGSAEFMVSKTPVLASTAYKFMIGNGQIENISTNGTGTANLQVKLISSSSSSATVEITSVPADFGVKTSANLVLLNATATAPPITTTTTSNTATTSNTQTTSTTNTTKNTTKSTNTTKTNTTTSTTLTTAQVMQLANATQDGTLMQKDNTLWTTDSGCTSTEYNNSYFSQFGTQPPELANYTNQLQVIPTGITYAVTHGTGTKYRIAYSSVGRSSLVNGPLLTLWINSSTSTPLINATFTGIFQGSSYSNLETAYQSQAAISGDCAAYLP